MMFWLVSIALAAAVSLTLVLSLVRNRRSPVARADYDIAVYRDQLEAVDRDLERGVIPPDVAERSRVEISRRILDADRARADATLAATQAPARLTLAVAGGVAVAVVGTSLVLYRQLGAPGYGDLPLQARLEMAEDRRETRPGQAEAEAEATALRTEPDPPAPDPDYLALMDRLRDTVATRPDDPRGLALLARNEAALGNFAAAHEAQARLIDVLGDAAGARHYSDLADMMILAAGGYVSPEAEAALSRALSRDPRNGTARYYMGLMHAQTGRPDRAFHIWRDLLADSAPDAPWVGPIRAQIEDAAARAGQRFRLPPPAPAPGLTGPTAEDMQAAGDMAPEDRQAMIRGMVEGLAERLATQGGPAADWARLISALAVLGETERARGIWQEGRTVFAGDPDGRAAIDAAAERSGLAP